LSSDFAVHLVVQVAHLEVQVADLEVQAADFELQEAPLAKLFLHFLNIKTRKSHK